MKDFYGISIRKLLIAIAVVAAVLLSIFAFFQLSFYIAPFIIALILSLILEPIIRLLTRSLKMGRRLAALISLLFLLVTLGLVLTIVIIKLVNEIRSLAYMLPGYLTELYNNILIFIDMGNDVYQWLPQEITSNIGNIISSVSNSLIKIANSIVSGAFSTVVLLPEVLVFTLITILSTFFLASDREKIVSFFKNQLPESWIKKVISIKNDMFNALFGYIRAQLILMSITFTELYIGFTIIGIRYTLLLAFLIAIIDALPVFGTGGILVPWAIYNFLTGDIKQGISLFVLYLIVLIIRQLIEPKVLGHQIGVHPLLTLISMYVGLRVIGVLGLILGPITFLLLKNIFSGILKGRTLKEVLR
jgi:sporulation integral membrane protein YtvI